MPLKDQILTDIKTAMKGGDQFSLTILRGISASIKNAEIAKQTKQGIEASIADEEVLAVISNEAKKRRDSITAYTTAGRDELAETEQKELLIIQKYLPTQLTAEEVATAVTRIQGATGANDFISLMKAAMAELKGKADGSLVAEAVKKKFE